MTAQHTRVRFSLLLLALLLASSGCEKSQNAQPPAANAGTAPALVGAWRAKIVFRGGALADMKDLEFLYTYNAGGTMTESSNYDEAANSTPPAYGIWREIAPGRFQTKYLFYTTKEPDARSGHKGDWWPAGYGVLTESITLSADGQSSTSTIKLDMYDQAGAVVAGAGEGTATGTRIVF